MIWQLKWRACGPGRCSGMHACLACGCGKLDMRFDVASMFHLALLKLACAVICSRFVEEMHLVGVEIADRRRIFERQDGLQAPVRIDCEHFNQHATALPIQATHVIVRTPLPLH